MRKVFIYCYRHACEKRFLDANKIYNYLYENGLEIINNPRDADIIIFMTCAVIDSSSEGSINKIVEFQKYDADLIVVGCLPAIDPDKLSIVFNGKTIITKELDKIDTLFPQNKVLFSNIDDANLLFSNMDNSRITGVLKKILKNARWMEHITNGLIDHILKNIFGERSFITYMVCFYRSFNSLTKSPYFIIRVSWGCLGNCSYCAIKKATGSIISKPLDECIKEFKKGLDARHDHIVITADDVGAYGFDIGKNVTELLNKITSIPGDYTLSIRNLYPWWVVKYIDNFVDILKRRKITHLGIPIESGCTRILKLMNRYSDIQKMKSAFLKLNEAFPDVRIHTHIITGFPTETQEEMVQTLRFIIDSQIDAGFIYRFSCKAGTKAENIEPEIPKNEIISRLKYSKKYLNNEGYKVIYNSKLPLFIFDKR